MVTDGHSSYAIFIYQCGDLEWSGGATIGFGAGLEFVSNHRLSGTPNVTSIACLSSSGDQYFSLVYALTDFGTYGNELVIIIPCMYMLP